MRSQARFKMRPKIQWIVVMILNILSSLLFQTTTVLGSDQSPRVVLLTLDGVRWQEFFHGSDPTLGEKRENLFPKFWGEFASQGLIFGDVAQKNEMLVSNSTYVSLPAYQSILAGFPQSCWTNWCKRTGVETFPERIVREKGLKPKEVATIASWDKIPNAVEHVPGSTFVNAGIEPLMDGTSDPELLELNEAQQLHKPEWKNARADEYTFKHALRYLKVHKPKFLFISLNDSDEWAHKGNYPAYLRTLQQYDEWIQILIQTLDQTEGYSKNTTLLITTDHGRGNGAAWKHHGPFHPESRFVWMYARGPEAQGVPVDGATDPVSHSDIRPTIEAAMGLVPQECVNCGHPIR